MSKELAKAYEPHEVEDRIYQFWVENGYFHAEPDPKEEALHHRHPAAQHHRPAAHGPRLGRDLGQDILIRWTQHAGLLCPVAARHRPRLHRHRGQDCGGHAGRGPLTEGGSGAARAS